MIGRFLLDRLGLVAAFYISAAVILAFAGLLTRRTDFGYGLLMATTILLIYLGAELARWWPFARQAKRLADADLDALANLPPGGNLDQAQCRELLARLYSLSVAERLRHQAAHQRHLTFINMWVHQMKTPVSAINLIAQRAEEAAPDAMASIQEETVKLADGLELVLNMARLQDFAVDFRIERVDLLATVRGAINARRRQFIRTGIFPEVDAAAEGDWWVLTDAKWNSFVIDQIVSNALKYGAQGGPAGQTLRFCLRRDGDLVTLAIADQGPGIPEEDLPRVFEPFFTGANGRRFADATGIGLYLVSEVVQKLGHHVRVESNAGTTVTLTYQK